MDNKELERLKNILHTLDCLRLYFIYIKNTKRKDSLKNIKKYFNNCIFISIVDYENENYDKLFLNSSHFKKYMKNNPDKVASKKKYKKSPYRILLRGVYN